MKGDKIVAFCDRHCNVIAPFVAEAFWEIERKGFLWGLSCDSTWDVDRTEPWPNGRDCQEDEALPF